MTTCLCILEDKAITIEEKTVFTNRFIGIDMQCCQAQKAKEFQGNPKLLFLSGSLLNFLNLSLSLDYCRSKVTQGTLKISMVPEYHDVCFLTSV